MQTDNVVIARILGARSVADYAVPFRLFNFVNVLLVMLSGSMWPAYADAMARQDGSWIRRSFKRVSIGGTAITLVATALLIIFGNRILALWVGPQIPASRALLIALGVQCVVYAYLQPINFLLIGIGRFKIQVICATVMAFVNLGLSIVLVKRYGIIGAVLGTVIAQLLVQVIPLTIAVRGALRDLGQKPILQVSAALEVSG
jgi:O-antigen/teichoic acid export membrane protein